MKADKTNILTIAIALIGLICGTLCFIILFQQIQFNDLCQVACENLDSDEYATGIFSSACYCLNVPYFPIVPDPSLSGT